MPHPIPVRSIRHLLVALVIAIACHGLSGLAVQAQPSVAPLPSAETPLTRIAFGSCLDQGQPQPIWQGLLTRAPQLMVMLGDNVYGSTPVDTLDPLRAAYSAQALQPEFAAARAKLPMLAIWDDHDFGRNDGGGDYALKREAADLFLSFWGPLPDRPADGGLYHARSFGPPGRRVQLLLLDTRSFRSSLKPKSASFPHWGRYEPDPDPAKTMLGNAQWSWLAERLAEPADVRIVVSSVQVLAEGHGFERWGNLPTERERLLALLATASSGRVVLVSGDRHYGAFYEIAAGGKALVEMTASSMNKQPPSPSGDAAVAPLVSEVLRAENVGLIDIDWAQRLLLLTLAGVDGATLASREVAF